MAVTIEKRPLGVVLDTCVSATINQDYNSLYATVNKTSHGLSDGDYVYIQSNVENYNGFWKVEVTNANEFILIDNPYVEWIVDATITYCPQLTTHGWSCVHLPIVYELGNTRWPVNSVDTARTISSISDDNGYVNLNLSGSLGTFEDLAFIKISSASDSDFDGVYQIIDKLSTSDVTINLAYSSVTASGLVGATIQLYYSNYNIVVKVYAGIKSTHIWADQKPYELAATLELIPDADNKVKFSINEILKGYVNTENNLLLATLPNNIDAWTQFYIEAAEQYDTSDGYTVTTFEGAFASDQNNFEGYAANSMLEFKNIHSGYLSEYLMNNTSGKFLTLFDIPVLFSGGYSDISFILPINDLSVSLKKQYYNNSVLQTTVTTDIESYDAGIYRVELDPIDCESYDRLDISVITNPNATIDISDGSNYDTGGTPWIGGSNNISDSQPSSDNYIIPFVWTGGLTYTITYEITVAIDFLTPSTTIYATFNSNPAFVAFPEEGGDSDSYSTDGIKNGTFVITPAASGSGYLKIYQVITGTGQIGIGIRELSVAITGGESRVSEVKQFKIDCACSNQEITLSWLNNLGGFEYWTFTGETEHSIDISNSGETKNNIFPQWPKSYGEHADTIRKQTFRDSRKREFIFSQFLTQDEADAIAFIKSSPLVQIVNSRQDRRTVLVDTDSFTKYKDGDKTYSISFNIFYTDDLPSQKL